MNRAAAAACVGLAALATFLTLKIVLPTPVPRVVAGLQPTVFLTGASVMIAVDGSCPVATDVHMPLLGTAILEDEALVPAELEVATEDPLPGGSCGGDLDVAIADAAAASTDEDGLPAPGLDIAASESPAALAATPVVASPRLSEKSHAQRTPPQAEALTAWWPARKPDAFNVLFVGEAAFGSAISILTDGRFDDADSANAHIEVQDAAGRRVRRRWQVATNRKMLLLPVKAGIYSVSIRSEFADAQGRQTGTASSGAVYVR